ncbi:MAG: GUN4 domain-containing protein [Trichodesmium sp. MAG_R04]|nr:GUN4 domain-containing protein [Trichodesmium sp. MAG_R04]
MSDYKNNDKLREEKILQDYVDGIADRFVPFVGRDEIETWVVLCEALGKRRKSYLFQDDIDNLPCEDLLTIDRLWVKYSGGKFGFRVQKQIYKRVNEDYGKFCFVVRLVG